MNPKTTQSISITYRKPADIKEVNDLSAEVGSSWKQAAIYLVGLRTVAGMLRKAKAIIPGK